MLYFQRTSKVTIAYHQHGTGFPLLLLHGFMGTGQTEFPKVVQFLAQSYHVITPDLRGYGASQPKPRVYGADFYRQDAEDMAALLDHLKIKKAIVMGYSDGGEVALWLPILAPSQVQAVITWGATGHFNPTIRGEVLSMLNYTWRTPHLDALHGSEHIEPMTQYWVQSMLAIINQGGDITFSRAKEIVAPTLMMLGEHDLLNPISQGHSMADAIPNGKFKAFSKTGHALHQEKPRRFRKTVLDFLRRHRP